MKKQHYILEGLKHIKEAKNVPVIPPNKDHSTPDGMKEGDTIQMLKDCSRMEAKTFWVCVGVEGEMNSNNQPWNFNVYVKIIPKTGEISKSFVRGSEFVKKEKIQKWLGLGYIKVLTPGNTYTEGELQVDDIKEMIKNMDGDKLSGISINNMVTSSGAYIEINIGETENSEKLHGMIKKALIARNIKLNYDLGPFTRGTSLLFINKEQ